MNIQETELYRYVNAGELRVSAHFLAVLECGLEIEERHTSPQLRQIVWDASGNLHAVHMGDVQSRFQGMSKEEMDHNLRGVCDVLSETPEGVDVVIHHFINGFAI